MIQRSPTWTQSAGSANQHLHLVIQGHCDQGQKAPNERPKTCLFVPTFVGLLTKCHFAKCRLIHVNLTIHDFRVPWMSPATVGSGTSLAPPSPSSTAPGTSRDRGPSRGMRRTKGKSYLLASHNQYLFRLREVYEAYTRGGGREADLHFGQMGARRGRG